MVNDRAARIAIDLRDARASLDELEAKLRTARDLVREAAVTAPLMALDRSASLKAKPVFTIVRKSDGQFQQLTADENTIVQPGDVIRVEGDSSAPLSGQVTGLRIQSR